MLLTPDGVEAYVVGHVCVTTWRDEHTRQRSLSIEKLVRTPTVGIYLYNKYSGSFDEITIMRVVSESSAQGSSSSATPTRTLSLATCDDVSCSQSRVRGSLGGWVELPAADQCSVEVNPSEQVLGWATQPDSPVDMARRQVDNGWGAYELTNEEGEITAVFIPAGGATLLTGSTQLYPILG